jgi:hypothetical protein
MNTLRPVVTLHQVQRLDRRDRPTAFSQPLAKIRALLDEPQFGNVRCGVFLDTAQILSTTLEVIRIEVAWAQGLDRDAAAGGAEFYDPLEQQILAGRRQVGQQPLGGPRGGRRRIKPRLAQGCRPIGPQINRHSLISARRLSAPRSQHVGLERQYPRLVDLVDGAARDPRQPPGTGVQTRGQNHGLVDTVGAGGDEVLVEPFGAHRGVVLDHRQSRADYRGIPAALDGGVDERFRIPVGEQRAIAIGFSGPRHGHAQRRRADALGDVPAVVVGSHHDQCPFCFWGSTECGDYAVRQNPG